MTEKREIDKRESGKPGGGAGRRDEVKGAPIWPATGPYPPGTAEVRTPGELIDSPYEESGRSEIFYHPSELGKSEQGKEDKGSLDEDETLREHPGRVGSDGSGER